MKICKTSALFVLMTGFIPLASHAQVVVTNPTGLAQWATEVTTLTNQLTMLKNTYASLTGSTGLGSLLSSDVSSIKTNLPSSVSSIYSDALNSGSSSYSSRASSILSTVIAKVDGMGRTDAMTYANSVSELKGATDRAVIETSYNNEMAELNNIQTLTNQIDSSTSAKDIADLQARIATARGAIAAESTKIAQLQAMMTAQDKILAEQKTEAVRRYAIGNASDDNTAPTVTP